jgi:hypothetical protein
LPTLPRHANKKRHSGDRLVWTKSPISSVPSNDRPEAWQLRPPALRGGQISSAKAQRRNGKVSPGNHCTRIRIVNLIRPNRYNLRRRSRAAAVRSELTSKARMLGSDE